MSNSSRFSWSAAAMFALMGCGARSGLEHASVRVRDDAASTEPISSPSAPVPMTTLFVDSEQPAVLLPEPCGPSDAAQVQPNRPSTPVPAMMGVDSDSECGNGRQEEYETCDDGNRTSNDGCDELCQIEPYYLCITGGQRCVRLEICGDSVLSASEECEDGNLIAGDGCSPSCQIEVDCSDGDLCTCGDGIVQANLNEVCDHGADNTAAYDGCTPKCTLAARCGDLIVQACGAETCDDGNRVGGDGCNADCNREQHWVR